MKIFIAGKIGGDTNYKKKFNDAAKKLKQQGHAVMNPATLPAEGFSHEQYLHITFAMIDVCDGVCMLSDWEESAGATKEIAYAIQQYKSVLKETTEPTRNIKRLVKQ